jgi:hypothetical protein
MCYTVSTSQAGKGANLKLAGMLLTSCCVLLLMLWRSGLIQQATVQMRYKSSGVCSAALDSFFGSSASNSTAYTQLPKPPHMVIYSHNCCAKSKVRACRSALRNGFGSCGSFGLADLHTSMLSPEGYSILTEEGARGAGYWLWKPLIILQELLRAEEGDVVVYMDADSEIMSNISPLLGLLDGQDVAGFISGETETNATKTDVLLMMNATDLRDTRQLYAGLILFRRSWQSIGFVSQWLTYCQDRRWMTNIDNTLLPAVLQGGNHPGFFVHRNDQALFSLLYKKWDFKAFPDPTANTTMAQSHPYPDFWMFHHTKVSEKKL